MISKITLLKTADKFLGSLATLVSKLFIKPKTINPEEITKILVIRPGGIGDAVLLIPALKILKKHYPDSQIDILAEKRNAGILKDNPLITNIYLYDDFNKNGLLDLFKNSYDAVIDTEQWHKLTSVVAYFTKAPIRIGFSTNGRADLYSKIVIYKQFDYEAISFINLVSALTVKKHRFDTNGGFLKKNKSKNKEFSKYRKQYKSVVGLFPGATVRERRWDVQNFASVAENLLQKNIGVIFLGGKNDIPEVEKIIRILGTKEYLNLTGKTSLNETTEIISEMDLLISSDSGLMHIAYGVGTRTLSLFGAGIEDKWAPKGTDNHVINKYLACSPCTKFGYTPKCPINVKCLTEISAKEVYLKAHDLVSN